MVLFDAEVAVVDSIVSEAQLRRAHRALRIATPFDAMSELLIAAVGAAARAMAARDQRRIQPPSIDLKHRAAGDFEN